MTLPTSSVELSNTLPIDIHIGTEKTGSTAIQRYLGLNIQRLSQATGTLVPNSLGIGSAVNLAAACQLSEPPDSLRRMRSLLTLHDVKKYFEKLQEHLSNEIANTKPERLLISCENLSSRLKHPDEVQRLSDFLAPFASGIRVIVYLRRQEDMIVSSHTTKIRNGFKGRFNYPPRGGERPDTHYDQLLSRWADVFGEDNIEVRLYERNRLVNADVVDDFCDWAAIPTDLERDIAQQNVSPDAQTLEIMRRMNHFVPHQVDGKPNPLRRNLMNALTITSNHSETVNVPPPNAEFLERFEAGNTEVARRWFSNDDSVPDSLFEAPSDRRNINPPSEIAEDELLQTAAHIWNYAQAEIVTKEFENNCLKAELLLAQGQNQEALAHCEGLCRKYPEQTRAVELLNRAQKTAASPRERN